MCVCVRAGGGWGGGWGGGVSPSHWRKLSRMLHWFFSTIQATAHQNACHLPPTTRQVVRRIRSHVVSARTPRASPTPSLWQLIPVKLFRYAPSTPVREDLTQDESFSSVADSLLAAARPRVDRYMPEPCSWGSLHRGGTAQNKRERRREGGKGRESESEGGMRQVWPLSPKGSIYARSSRRSPAALPCHRDYFHHGNF